MEIRFIFFGKKIPPALPPSSNHGIGLTVEKDKKYPRDRPARLTMTTFPVLTA
jgi:hypothetical protein